MLHSSIPTNESNTADFNKSEISATSSDDLRTLLAQKDHELAALRQENAALKVELNKAPSADQVNADLRRKELELTVSSLKVQVQSLVHLASGASTWKRYAAYLHCSFRYQLGTHIYLTVKKPHHLFKNIAKCIDLYKNRSKIPYLPWPGGNYPSEKELIRICSGVSGAAAKQNNRVVTPVPEYVPLYREKREAREQGKPVWIIKCPAEHRDTVLWGDYHFALSLKKSLEKLGHFVEVQLREHWEQSDDADVVLVLRGLFPYHPKRVPGCLYFMWNISHPEAITDEEYEEYDALFIGSKYYANILAKRLNKPVFPLLQCTDTSLFYETEEEEATARNGLLFIGNSRIEGRPSVNWAAKYNANLKVYGNGWETYLPNSYKYIAGRSIENKDIRAQFVKAKATLNDHWASMTAYQFINNRIFDALACGLPVITDYSDELKQLFPDELLYYHDEASFRACLQKLNTDYDNIKKRTSALKERIKTEFSFDARAQELVGHMQILKKMQSLPTPAAADETDQRWDVCFFWKQNDIGLFGRRPDMIMKHLAKDPRIRKIVEFDTPVTTEWIQQNTPGPDAIPYSRNFYMINNIYQRENGHSVSDKIIQYNYIIPQCEKYDPYIYRKYVRDALTKEGVGTRKILMWVCPKVFQINELLDEIKPDLLVADYMDDERQFTKVDSYKDKLGRNYSHILQLSDYVFCNCENIRKMLRSMRPDLKKNIHVFPSAVEIPKAPTDAADIPERLKDIPHPIIGYVGNLSSRFDVDLAEYLSDQKPDWHFVYIGSLHFDDRLSKLRNRSNVHLLNVVPYDEVPSYIRQFDVAIMPHTTNSESEAMSPLKLFVYAANYKPIVTMKVPNIDQIKHIAKVAENYEDFLQKTEEALANGGNIDLSEYQHFFDDNNWDKRINEMLTILFGDSSKDNC